MVDSSKGEAGASTDFGRAANLDNKSFQSQLIRIVSIPVVFILILLVFFHVQNAYRYSLASEIRLVEARRLALLRFEKSVSEIENGLRGYILSGRTEFYTEILTHFGEADYLSRSVEKLVKSESLASSEVKVILEKFTKFKEHVNTTIELRKNGSPGSEEIASKRMVSKRHLFIGLTDAMTLLERRLAEKTRVLESQMALIVRRTSLLEVLFTFLLAFFVVFIMIRQLKKMTFNYRTLLQKNLENMEKIQESSRTKDLFLANMSHEIRTPLGAILGFSELLHAKDNLDSESKNHISFIHRNSEHLLGLIDDLFDLSRLAADKLDIDYEQQHLGELIQDIENNFSSRVVDKKIDLDIRLDTRIPEKIESDPVRLTQIITNLVGNAIKFSPPKSKVSVVFSFANDQLQVDVIDQGIGIDPSVQQVIFEAFSQADSKHSRNFGGAGLGLSISKKLAKAMGGDLVLVSSQLDHGSHFRVTIPCASSSTVYLDRDKLGHLDPKTEETDAHIETNPRVNFSHRKILLAEDSKENQILFKIFIESTQAKLDIVDNGTDAVRRALSEEYDLILMDIQMPGLDGYEAVGILRGSEYQKKIIALTAHTMKGERERCLSSGFDDYLSKPVSQAKLVRTMAKAMRH